VTGAVVWITGLPASGKSTLAGKLATRLRAYRTPTLVLDSDDLHEVLIPRHGFDEAGRDAFYRTLAGLACLAARQGQVVIVPATANRRIWRDHARAHAPAFVEVFVATPPDECARRDPKGLYANAAARPRLPGVGVPYEAPAAPEVVAHGGEDARALEAIVEQLSRSPR
jgi:adenylylsulfate kinase